MFNRAIRISIALSCLVAQALGWMGCPTASAQIPVSRLAASHSTGATLRPVAKFGSEQRQPIAANSTQPQGWNLRWRQSENIRPIAASAVTGRNVFADDQPSNPSRAVARVSSDSENRGFVSQAVHAAAMAPQEEELFPLPNGGSSDAARANEIDFFDDPFGLPKAPSTQPSPGEPSGSQLQAPATNNLPGRTPQTLPSESQSMDELPNELRSQPPSLPESLPESMRGDGNMELPQTRQAAPMPTLPNAPANIPQPIPDPLPQSAPTPKALRDDQGPSLPDLMKQANPQKPRPPRNSLELLPPPADRSDKEPSSSDREPFDNPFEREDEAQADRLDRDRLREKTEDETDSSSNAMKDELDSLDVVDLEASTIGLSCDEFRNRISSQTIREVSLDISPPFRPDVISEGEYQKLKSKFDEKQASRQWRTIDGRPLATGRLVDLAYEKAIIESDSGSKEEIAINQLGEADLAFISENWGLPSECLIKQVAYTPRTWTKATMTWKASNLCHKPLYFEEVNLERYGHTAGPILQPIVSSAHFFANIAVLPYKKGIHPPSECQYALGYYRPGDCAPWIVPPVPLSVRGAVRQAAVMTAGFWLIP